MHLLRGRWAEQAARAMLEREGLDFVLRNYRSRFGEIDLVMRDNDMLVFVEVRFRRTVEYGDGAETIDRRKRERLRKTALDYLKRRRIGSETPCRFDVVAISGRPGAFHSNWISDAF